MVNKADMNKIIKFKEKVKAKLEEETDKRANKTLQRRNKTRIRNLEKTLKTTSLEGIRLFENDYGQVVNAELDINYKL